MSAGLIFAKFPKLLAVARVVNEQDYSAAPAQAQSE
jgi:hypothetical protein